MSISSVQKLVCINTVVQQGLKLKSEVKKEDAKFVPTFSLRHVDLLLLRSTDHFTNDICKNLRVPFICLLFQ